MDAKNSEMEIEQRIEQVYLRNATLLKKAESLLKNELSILSDVSILAAMSIGASVLGGMSVNLIDMPTAGATELFQSCSAALGKSDIGIAEFVKHAISHTPGCGNTVVDIMSLAAAGVLYPVIHVSLRKLVQVADKVLCEHSERYHKHKVEGLLATMNELSAMNALAEKNGEVGLSSPRVTMTKLLERHAESDLLSDVIIAGHKFGK